MKAYKLNKRYIIKMILSRFITLAIIDIFYIIYAHKIADKYMILASSIIYIINVIGIMSIVIMPFIEYLSYKYLIGENAIEIKCGVIFRKNIYISRENIKYVIAQKDPLDHLLRISSLKLYTTAGHRTIKSLDDKKLGDLWVIMKEEEL